MLGTALSSTRLACVKLTLMMVPKIALLLGPPLSSLKHHLTCPASSEESSWCWWCSRGHILPCDSSKPKTARMKLLTKHSEE